MTPPRYSQCSVISEKFPELQLISIVLVYVYEEVKMMVNSRVGVAMQNNESKNVIRTTAHMLSNICLKINAALESIIDLNCSGNPSSSWELSSPILDPEITRS